jgi:hypothetical protein
MYTSDDTLALLAQDPSAMPVESDGPLVTMSVPGELSQDGISSSCSDEAVTDRLLCPTVSQWQPLSAVFNIEA